jgi:hypothetical protein
VADDVIPESTGEDDLIVTAMIEATIASISRRAPVSIQELLRVAA